MCANNFSSPRTEFTLKFVLQNQTHPGAAAGILINKSSVCYRCQVDIEQQYPPPGDITTLQTFFMIFKTRICEFRPWNKSGNGMSSRTYGTTASIAQRPFHPLCHCEL